jgi:hypothetical protein
MAFTARLGDDQAPKAVCTLRLRIDEGKKPQP